MTPADATRKRIASNPLNTIAEVRDAQRALALMEYLLTPVALWASGKSCQNKPCCSVCQKTAGSIYQVHEVWYCLDHIPNTTTFPIGLHGEEFKSYQERRK
jgi:hypothetical protein